MRSIRASLVVGTVVVTLGAFSAAGIAVYHFAKNTMMARLDTELREEVHIVASTVRIAGGRVHLEFQELDMPEFTSEHGPGFLQLWLDDGSVLYRSPSLAGADIQASATAPPDAPFCGWMRMPNGSRVRGVAMAFEAQPDHELHDAVEGIPLAASHRGPVFVRVVLAALPEEIDEFLERLRALLIIVGALAGLMATAMLAYVIGSSLRPLNVLAAEIESVGDDNLSARVEARSIPHEMGPIVRQLNELLARLEDAFQRERTFSADIAHELRTPIAGVLSAVEVVLSRPRPVDDYRETLEEVLPAVRRVQSMVETLLYLGRLESGQIEIEETAVDIRDLVQTAWEPLAATAGQRRLTVEWDVHDAAHVITDPLLLEIAIRNVLENAVL
jgi:two-component system sensor histidine kinase QseC